MPLLKLYAKTIKKLLLFLTVFNAYHLPCVLASTLAIHGPKKSNRDHQKVRLNSNMSEEEKALGGQLLDAVEKKNLKRVCELVGKIGAGINYMNEYLAKPRLFELLCTPLMQACHTFPDKAIVAKLLTHPLIDINLSPPHPKSFYGPALHLTCKAGSEDVCRLLLSDDRLDISNRSSDGSTALHDVCKTEGIITTHSSSGSSISVHDYEKREIKYNFDDNKKRMEIIKLLIGAGIDLNLKNKNGETALTIACSFANDELIATLIDHGKHIIVYPEKDELSLFSVVLRVGKERRSDIELDQIEYFWNSMMCHRKASVEVLLQRGVMPTQTDREEITRQFQDDENLQLTAKNNDPARIELAIYGVFREAFKQESQKREQKDIFPFIASFVLFMHKARK